MKKNIFHHELLAPLRLATGKAKRAAKILTYNQQQALQGLAGTSFVTRGQGYGYGPAKQGGFWCSQGVGSKGGLKRLDDLIWAWQILHQKMQIFQRCLFYAPISSEDNLIIENFKDSVTNNDSNTDATSKLSISPGVNRCESTVT
jgi:hypothetical protein